MFSYSIIQWLSFFYFYCFIGWIWESSYVSITHHKLTNRGFLNGPFLPLYGSGACIVLMATLPVKDNLVLVFLLGMTAATVLEYITGAVMESIFKVRYWDYTNDKFNLNGYICLECSIAWGVFSILMIKFVHHPVEQLFSYVPYNILKIATYIISVLLVIDTTMSVRDALDLKDVLYKFTENNEEIKKLQKRFDVFVAVLDDEKSTILSKIGEYTSGSKDKLVSEFENLKEKLNFEKDKFSIKNIQKNRFLRLLRRNPDATSKLYKDAIEKIKSEK